MKVRYDLAVGDKNFVWDNYILPKYNPELVQKIKAESISNPIELWAID